MADDDAAAGDKGAEDKAAEGAAAEEAEGRIPISIERIKNCLDSSRFWVRALPRYADDQQRRADFWSLLAGVLSAVTGLAIWPTLEQAAGDATATALSPASVAISIAALLAAVCALVPRVKNYAENAGAARELTSRYGSVVGDLLDLSKRPSFDQEAARTAVRAFEEVKAKKDALRGLPIRERVEADDAIAEARTRQRVAEAKRQAAQAEAGVQGGK